MTTVASTEACLPEAPYQLLATDVPPAMLDVALIAHLIHDHGFPKLLPVQIHILTGLPHVLALYAGMGDPRPGVVIQAMAVVNGPQVPIRVFLDNRLGDILPVRCGLLHEVILIRKGPPDIPESGEP